ncbi:MAG: phosphogluconate dehydratase [Robiginitomaculum sp.]|nr:MAG: phosphogluconate dehydratase [Robiginitomaculum sp.]
MTNIHPIVQEITDNIIKRSQDSRRAYLDDMHRARPKGLARKRLTEGNQAHAFAGCALHDKKALLGASWPSIGIVTSYNDMLSAHQPFEKYPDIIRTAARTVGATAQVAGGVPAMCDGVTQGQTGMELSLLSRDVIAMATAISLSHDTFDTILYLGICDKIVPGLLIGALQFGHMPGIFVPAGPMPSGLPNKEKARIRQLFAEGKVDRAELLKAESESYHSPGTCTFYGTANSNQMLMEIMGLHIPGSAFVNPGTPLREALTIGATKRCVEITSDKDSYIPIGEVISEKTIVNAIVGLMATGGSTNLTLHIPAIAKAAGIHVDWDDFAQLSKVTPQLTRIYPNGYADVNHFHAAGGMGLLISELLNAGLLHDDVMTVAGKGLSHYAKEPGLDNDKLVWRDTPKTSGNLDIIRPASDPFSAEGGLSLLEGPLGRGVIKISAVSKEHRYVRAPAKVFDDQNDLMDAFNRGELNQDLVAVIRFQGPSANGMPELHKLTPPLGVLQDKGFKVALVTDGRMSGASGKIPAAIHVGPEAIKGGALARVQDGDIIILDAEAGILTIDVDAAEFLARPLARPTANTHQTGFGRNLFSSLRHNSTSAETGATCFDVLSTSSLATSPELK